MRDFGTLVKEAKALALQTDEEALVWFDRLTPEERTLFLKGVASLLREICQFWKERILPGVDAMLVYDGVSFRLTAIGTVVRGTE